MADSMIYNTEKMLKENKSKLSDEVIKPLEAALKTGKEKLDSQNLEDLK